jgi:FAD/FMN-containing dehydrogenase
LKLSAERVHFTPNEINYIWSAQQGELVPACRVEPVSAKEVSVILGIVKQAKCHFAIKSGGHSQHPGASNAADGVTIDLARMNKVTVSKDRKSVQVGAGAVWLDVYRAVEAEDLLVVGGRVADVGVGGLLTGGTSP